MAFRGHSIRLFTLLSLVAIAGAQTAVELEAFMPRTQPAFTPEIDGRAVTVRGIVSAPRADISDYSLLAIQNQRGTGLVLESHSEAFSGYVPGDRVEAQGVAGHRAGLPVLRVGTIRKTGTGPAPKPQEVTPEQLRDFASLGRLVTFEAEVQFVGENAGGDAIRVRSGGGPLMIFIPRQGGHRDPRLSVLHPGDQIRVTGISSIYSPLPPHDKYFQVVTSDPRNIQRVARAWLVSPVLLAYLALGALFAAGVWWWRERLLGTQRRTLRGIMSISEDVLDAASPSEIVDRLARQARTAVGATDVELFLFSAADDALQRVSGHGREAAASINVDTPIGTLAGAAALCFRNRALLRIPDTKNSPILQQDTRHSAAAAVFVPMFAAGELAGVLAVYLHNKISGSNPDQDVALQHLGNQIAASIKLQDRQQMRDQLLRTEKMAAAGQLISGIATDLRTPLENIGRTARALKHCDGSGRELTEIARDAERGLEMIDHLLSFARMEQRDARTLDVNSLVSSLVEMRAEERTIKHVRCENSLPVESATVLADRSQLEQAVLTVLVHAEHAAAESFDRQLRVSSRIVGRKVLIAIDCSPPASGHSSHQLNLGDYFGFPVAQVIVQSHGGDLRHLPNAKTGVRFELELPLHETTPVPAAQNRPEKPLRVLTCILIEPDLLAQRKLLAMLAARGHRAVPASTAEHAADMVQRMQFDVVFCAANLPGLNWIELFQRVRRKVGVFGLMLEAYDPEASRVFSAGEGQLLTKPIADRELDDFLAGVEVRIAAARS